MSKPEPDVRALASYKCAKAHHFLAWVESTREGLVVVVNGPWADAAHGYKRNRRDVTQERLPAESVGDWSGAYATCGCRSDHRIDLSDLVARAKSRETEPVIVPAVRGRRT